MTDICDRAGEAMWLVRDESLSAQQRVCKALPILLELAADLRGSIGQQLQETMTETDELVKRALSEDDDVLGDARARGLLKSLEGLAPLILACGQQQLADEALGKPLSPDEVLDPILAELDRAGSWVPVQAIRQAREHRERIVPWLIDAIRQVTADVLVGDMPLGHSHFYALFLLTESTTACRCWTT